MGGRNLPIPIDLAIGLYNSLYYRTSRYNANPSYKLASIPRYDDIVRTAAWAGSARAAGRRPAGDGGRPQNRAPHTGSGRGRPAADGGVLDITAAVWTADFHGGVLATKSERKMLASTCLYSLYMPGYSCSSPSRKAALQ